MVGRCMESRRFVKEQVLRAQGVMDGKEPYWVLDANGEMQQR
jgi:hypothetical protein